MKSFNNFVKIIISIFYFKVVLSAYSSSEPYSCKIIEPKLPQTRLKLYIFCDYEQAIRPNKQSQNTTVNVMLIPKSMSFNSASNEFTLSSWLKVDWVDEHLKWNSQEFDEVTELHMKSEQIWTPDLFLLNSADMNSNYIFSSSASCLVAYTGLVVCVPLIDISVLCSSDYERWPFEKQICQIIFSSYIHYNDEIYLKFPQNKILMESFVPHQEWTIVNVTGISRTEPLIMSKIMYEFHLRRHTSVILIVYIIPIIVLMLFTLVILWMDVNSVERIALTSLNFICHIFCLYDIQWKINENGNKTPYLLVFYQNSLILTTFSLVITITLRKLEAMNVSSPKWISSVEAFILSYQIGRLFILSNEEAKCFVDVNESDNNTEYEQSVSITLTKPNVWKRFAKIVECLAFFGILLTYIIMCLTFIPK